jgi:MoaA/NifB/PqqE/SkfB family radical SAM enzyme
MSFDDMRRVADVLVRMRLRRVLFSGGEPLLVQGLPQLAEQLVQGGISVSLYSSGWLLTEAWLPDLLRLFSSIHISLDGATAEVHDAIRGRKGSFERALRALSLLDVASGLPRSPHGRTLNFGIDCVVLQSNFHQLEAFCSEIVPLFPSLQFLNLGAGVPTGLASREGFDELELINEEQLERMRDPRFAAHLRSLAPGLGERLHITDNFALLMDPESLRNGTATTSVLQLEPDGQVRAMAIYEGTIGHILREPPEVLWQRAQARLHDPFVMHSLSKVRTLREWAAATRQIDLHFASDANRLRISRRAPFGPRVILPTG